MQVPDQATEEQRVAIDKFGGRGPLKIAAFAGAGKTTTLTMLAKSRSSRGIYIAFNRAVANEAKEKFPRYVDCRTTHSIAFRAIMPAYGLKEKLTESIRPRQLAEVMKFKDRVFQNAIRLDGVHQAHLVLGTVKRFCQSADSSIGITHVPTYGRLLGARENVVVEIKNGAVTQAASLWARMVDKGDQIPLGHDGYLKLWALRNPELAADYILLDEAQDTNGVVLGVLKGQRAQIVYVGDRHQQIYEWRGAVNAMETIIDCNEATLSQSFRFGDAIAQAASKVLGTLGETRRIRGNPAVSSVIVTSGVARTVLARTNATVILEVLDSVNAGRRAAVVGGTQELVRLLSDVYELKAGKPGRSPEFFGFDRWADVVEFAGTEEGESIRNFVQLVEQHGEGKLWAAVKKVEADESSADVVLSTAHKAKGREWDSVRLAPDFVSTRLGPDPDAASEARLFYVAMTRAKKSLIVDSEVLATFASDAWKRTQPQRGQVESQFSSSPRPRSKPNSSNPPRPEQRPDIREVNPTIVRQQHPGAQTSPSPRPRPEPNSANHSRSAPQTTFREVDPSIVRRVSISIPPAVTPATTQPNAPNSASSSPPILEQKPDSSKASIWRRITRFFG
jgi:hypothetical protein